MSQSTDYSSVITTVQAAIKADVSTGNKWQQVGAIIPAFYGTEAALAEVKAQFIADAILPAIDKRHAAALATDLPRKNSAEYGALDQPGRDKWEATNEAKKAARSTCDTYFKRVLSYAFPKEKAEAAPKSLKTKLAEAIADAIGKCEKAEAPDFDVAATLSGLRAALAAVSK